MTLRECWIIFAASTMLFLVSGCKEKYPPPGGELCTPLNSGNPKLACDDNTKSETQRRYYRDIKRGDVIAPSSRYKETYAYCADLRERLIKCERAR